MSNLVPLGDNIIVEQVEAESTTASGIILTESAKEKPQKAKIIAVGPGKRDDDGKHVAMDVKVGDVVIYSKYAPTEIKVDGKEYMILSEGDVLAIVK